MKFSANNFLQLIKQIVMGGGYMKDGKAVHNDAGYLHDMNFTLNDLQSVGTLTDNTGGTAGTTLAANAVKQTVYIPLGDMALLVNSQTFNIPIPFAFTITGTPAFRADVAITTGGKAVTLTTEINTTPTTGGVISVSGTYATGVTQAASAAVTANNVGVAGDVISIVTSSVTTFTEGTGHVELTIINNDLANSLSSLAAQANLATLDASETNLLVQSFPANTTFTGSFVFVIPRDYDEATDVLRIHIGAAMSGSTDTPTLTASGYYKRPGSSVATLSASVNGTTLANAEAGVTTALALSTADQLVVFDLSKKGLQRDDAVTIKFTAAAHTTNAVLVYFVEPVYRSTLVSYHESDGSPRDGKTGSFLR